MMITL